MNTLRKKDIPLGAAVTIAALVLLVSVVKGREGAGVQPSGVVPTAAPAREAPVDEGHSSADEIDLERLKRPKREGAVQDLFPSKPLAVAPTPVVVAAPPPRPVPPPAPTAPPLPFKYLGRLADGSAQTVFLERNQIALSASVGDVIDSLYKVEAIAEASVQFTYLPLGSRQILSIPAQH